MGNTGSVHIFSSEITTIFGRSRWLLRVAPLESGPAEIGGVIGELWESPVRRSRFEILDEVSWLASGDSGRSSSFNHSIGL